MAQQEVKIDADKLSCSICSELLKDPVTIPCGHSYCKSCISRHWDQEEKTKQNSFSCPMCRKNFSSRTGLVKNTVLADLVEELRETQPAAHDCLPGPQDVACDMCTVRKRRASKSCMQCIVSYCEEHLQPHYDVSALKKHKLMDPCESQQENMCSQHNEVKKIFCRTDQKCICYLCHIDEHKGHDTVSAEAEMTERKKKLEAGRQKTSQIIQEIDKDLFSLQKKLKAINQSADKVVSENEKMAAEMISFISRMSSDLTHKIRQQQTTEVHQIEELLRRKEKEKELQKQRLKSTKLEQLLRTVSCTHFLENYPATSQFGELSRRASVQGLNLHDFENVSKALSQEKNKLNATCTNVFRKLAQMVVPVEPQVPKTNIEFSHYAVQLTLDQSTANTHLTLSEDNRKVTSVKEAHLYPPYLERFSGKAQVLIRDPLPARCYWEVQWSGLGVSVGVAYNNIKREGPDSGFGSNDKSWVLDCSTRDCYVYRHKGGMRPLSACNSFRVGVFLDHKAGILSFYEVSETNKLIHKVQTKFTQPLYAGLGVHFYGATAKMCVKEGLW